MLTTASTTKIATTEESTTSKSTDSASTITTPTEVTTQVMPTTFLTIEERMNASNKISETTPVQTKVFFLSTSNSTILLETSMNPTTTPDNLSTTSVLVTNLSNPVNKTRITTHATSIGQKSGSTSQVLSSVHSSTQLVSTSQTTDIPQNTPQKIRPSSSTIASSSGSTPVVAKKPTKTAKTSTIEETNKNTGFSPRRTINPQNAPLNQFTTNSSTNSQEHTTESTLSAVQSTLKISSTVFRLLPRLKINLHQKNHQKPLKY